MFWSSDATESFKVLNKVTPDYISWCIQTNWLRRFLSPIRYSFQKHMILQKTKQNKEHTKNNNNSNKKKTRHLSLPQWGSKTRQGPAQVVRKTLRGINKKSESHQGELD